MKDLIITIIDHISGAYYWLCFKGEELKKDKRVRAITAWLGFITLFLIVMAGISLIFSIKSIMVPVGIISAIIFLIAYGLCDTLTRMIGKASTALPNKLGGITKTVEDGVEELRTSIIFPLCTVSLSAAFIAFWVNMFGFGSVWGYDMWVIILAILFFSIFGVYIGTKKKWTGKIMFGVMVFVLVIYAVEKGKNPVSSFVRNNISNPISKLIYNSGLRGVKDAATLGMTTNKVAVYTMTKGKRTKTKTLPTGSAIKILNPEDEGIDYSGDRMIKIQVPDGDGSFAGMDTLFVVLTDNLVWGEAEYRENKSLIIRKGKEIYVTSYEAQKPIALSVPIHKNLTFTGFEFGELVWSNRDANTPGIGYYNILVDVPYEKISFSVTTLKIQPERVIFIKVS